MCRARHARIIAPNQHGDALTVSGCELLFRAKIMPDIRFQIRDELGSRGNDIQAGYAAKSV